jgi:hypothetical protein
MERAARRVKGSWPGCTCQHAAAYAATEPCTHSPASAPPPGPPTRSAPTCCPPPGAPWAAIPATAAAKQAKAADVAGA